MTPENKQPTNFSLRRAGSEGAINIRNVSKIYDPHGVNVLAVDNCSVDIAPGEFCVIVGPSGCGKTTLLNAIAGLSRNHSGEILLDGTADLHAGIYGSPELRTNGRISERRAFPLEHDHQQRGLWPVPSKAMAFGAGCTAAAQKPVGGAWPCPISAIVIRMNCLRGCAAASRSPAPSSTVPRSCCSTSHSGPWMPHQERCAGISVPGFRQRKEDGFLHHS